MKGKTIILIHHLYPEVTRYCGGPLGGVTDLFPKAHGEGGRKNFLDGVSFAYH